MKQSETYLVQKSSAKYFCKCCDYSTSRESQYNRHLNTRKHKMKQLEPTICTESSDKYKCNLCKSEFNSRTTLWRHSVKCSSHKIVEHKIENEYNTDLVKQLIPLIKDLIIDIIPVLQPNHTDNSNTFNINMFLNEQCKDAMNMTDFIESIQLSLEDMKHYGDKGQTNGMANILIDKLNTMEIVKRPVHCSDIKKEIIYVKDDDKWEKEEKHNPKIKSALDTLTKKSIQAMPYMENNPDEYVKTISEVLKDPREDNKIISQLVKKIIV